MAQRRMITRDLNEDINFEKLPSQSKWMLTVALLYSDCDGYIKVKDILFYSQEKSEFLDPLQPHFIIIDNDIAYITVFQDTQTLKRDRYKPSALFEHHKIKRRYEFKKTEPKRNPNGARLE